MSKLKTLGFILGTLGLFMIICSIFAATSSSQLDMNLIFRAGMLDGAGIGIGCIGWLLFLFGDRFKD